MIGEIGGIASYRARTFGVFALVLCIWVTSGLALHRFVVDQTNASQLDEASQQLKRRADKAIDYVVIASTELLLAGQTACAGPTHETLRQLVLDTGTTADIYLVTPNGTCSGFGELSAELPGAEVRASWEIGRNPAFRIGRLPGDEHDLIGVSWGFGTELELLLVISADAILFDVLPDELRSHGVIQVLISDESVAGYIGDQVGDADTSNWPSYPSMGDRYPINVTIQVDPDTLATWHSEIPTAIALTWIVFGTFVAATASFTSRRARNLELERFTSAIKGREITPYFQPIINLQSGRVIGCEALARWIRPNGEHVSPAKFIPLVEQYGLDDELLTTMLEQAARDLRQELLDRPDFYIGFNVTPDQLSRPGFADFAISLAEQNDIKPSQICIEITERQIIASPEEAAQTTKKLDEAGFKIAIDDAGTGHNGMAAIQMLDVTTIKIDKFFIDEINVDPRSRVMVDMFVSVASRYGMNTVAEGVETEQQAMSLLAAGVTSVQGFHYSKPVPADEFLFAINTSWNAFARNETRTNPDNEANANRTRSAPTAQPSSKAAAADGTASSDEARRLRALYNFDILDTEPEVGFDRIPRIIKNALNLSAAGVAFIDKDRRWFKAVEGASPGSIPRHHSLCNTTIQHLEPTIVPDTLKDERFASSPLVVNAPFIRAYVGVPIRTTEGACVGSVCAIHKEPRDFTTSEIELIQDLSDIVMEQLELRKVTHFDELTGIRSMRGFKSEVDRELLRSEELQQPFSLIALDIDDFQRVNDEHGHNIGDQVLRAFASVTNDHLEERHILGRLNGGMFGVGLPGTTMNEALYIASFLRTAISDADLFTGHGSVSVKASLGVASSSETVIGFETLLGHAEQALNRAKRDGRNRVSAYSDEAA